MNYYGDSYKGFEFQLKNCKSHSINNNSNNSSNSNNNKNNSISVNIDVK